MGIAELGGIIAMTTGILTILSKIGNVYDEIRQTKYKVESVDKSIDELKLLDKNLEGRICAIERFLAKTTEFEIR